MSNPDRYSDRLREEKASGEKQNQSSKFKDLVYYESSRTPGFPLAMLIHKPIFPGYILVTTHGWHMSIPKYTPNNDAPTSSYLYVEVDMRGRAFSDGKQDCNGYELYDVIDAVEYVKRHYAHLIKDPDVVYFEGGSGSGGNCYELLNKFPDYFAAATAMYGITDYAKWYEDDTAFGEFRDEMDMWLGTAPDNDPMAYDARSGLHGMENLYTPLYITHGTTDERVQIVQARRYMEKAARIGKLPLITYYEMEGVGSRDHMGHATEEHRATIARMSEENRAAHRTPVELPRAGGLWVHGYLVTRHFSLFLDSIDKVAWLDYDLEQGRYCLSSTVPVTYTLTCAGEGAP